MGWWGRLTTSASCARSSARIGFTHADAEVVIGTSAGSAIGAYLRTGWTTDQLMGRAHDLQEAAPSPVAGSPIRVARHAVGSAYILARTAVRVPSVLSVPPASVLRRAFPAGLVTIGEGLSILDRELPRRWPEEGLWLSAYDLVQRRRVVLSSRDAPYLPLPDAVRASCAIPGVYAPVHVGDTVLVDGGVWSLTNLDLALAAGCDVAICIAPSPTTSSSLRLLRVARSAISRRDGWPRRWPQPVATGCACSCWPRDRSRSRFTASG